MERKVVFLVLAAFVAAVSCNPDDDSSPRTKQATIFADDLPKYPYQYQVMDELTKVPCILANMSIALEVKYKPKDGTENSKTITVPKDATASGNCAPVISTLLLTWGKDKQSTVKFLLFNDHTNFSVVSVALDLYIADAAEDRVKEVFNTDTGMLSGNLGNELTKCDKSSIQFDNSSMTMTNIFLIAFNTDKNVISGKDVQCTSSTIFPYIISTNKDTIATRVKMAVTIEIPYTHTNGSVVKHKRKLPFGQVKNITNNDGNKQSHSADLQWDFSSNTENYKLSLTVREHDNGTAYIDAVAVDISIDKKDLDASADVTRKGHLDLRLFPVALGNGLYSCKTGNVLRFGDVRIELEDVLFAPFNSEKRWEARKATGCDQEAKKQFNYVVKDPNLGVDCILGNMTIAINVTYKKNDKNTGNSVIQVPPNAATSGHCDAHTPYMELTWPEAQEDGKDIMNKLRLSLYYNTKTGLYYANFVRADIYLSKTQFPDAINQYLQLDSNMTLMLFPNKMINGYYKCANATEATIDEEVKIKITNVQLMAFNDQEDVSIKVKESGCYKNDKDDGKDDGKDNGKNNGTNPVQKFHYRVYNTNTNVTCILADMVISLKLNNQTKDGTKEVVVRVPDNTTHSGTCDDEKSVLHLTWPLEPPKDNSHNSLILTFGKESSRSFLKAIKTNITLKGTTFMGSEENMMYFAADATSCFYKCESKVEVTASNFTAIFSDLVLIAFNQDADLSHIPLRSEENCSSENVGAIVGGIIGGLVIIGIIWFVICTCRRSRY